ncbi:MAG: hypothetical protein QM653_07135 [Dysgonomonas sp.]|uniref:DUF1016 N-terminal domain-containing protein n=1 Tax=Dysgonomonas sp. TaxID=1891233 RepID=UPI0039E2D2D9
MGCYIVEYEQNGNDRAIYGEGLLIEMANRLKSKGVKGLRERELHTCRRFYMIYPQILRKVNLLLRFCGRCPQNGKKN